MIAGSHQHLGIRRYTSKGERQAHRGTFSWLAPKDVERSIRRVNTRQAGRENSLVTNYAEIRNARLDTEGRYHTPQHGHACHFGKRLGGNAAVFRNGVSRCSRTSQHHGGPAHAESSFSYMR